MTAAGVAGGMMLGNALMGAFSGGGAAAAATSAAEGAFGQDAVPASSPWTDPTGTGNDAQADLGNDAQPDAGGYDAGGYGADDAGSYDAGGGYDEEI